MVKENRSAQFAHLSGDYEEEEESSQNDEEMQGGNVNSAFLEFCISESCAVGIIGKSRSG